MKNENLEIAKLDKQLKEKLKREIEYKTWFKSALEKAYIKNDVIYLICENDFYVDIIKKRYSDLLKEITNFKIEFLNEKENQ